MPRGVSPRPAASTAKAPAMIRIAPAILTKTKPPDAALGGAPGSKEPAQINHQCTKLDQAMPVRGTPQ